MKVRNRPIGQGGSTGCMTSDEKLELTVRAADSKKARDMVLLDLQGLTLMTDYFFICTGTSSTHIRSITDAIVEAMKRAGMGGIRVEGYEAALWVLMDYGDVVAHVMNAEQRDYYDLETFWSDAPRLPLPVETNETGTAAEAAV
jgi:ribosome-associated protein